MNALIKTNPYLINSKRREASISRSVRSSCGVEGIIAKPSLTPRIKIDSSRSRDLFNKIKSSLQGH